MKTILGTSLSLILLFSCVAPSNVLRAPSENIIDISQDEEEYEVMVLDPGFETWFATTWNVAKDRSVNYYSHWNNRYVSEWNYKATQPHTSRFFDSTIQYDPTINYGIAVERKLYYYFRWVDTKLGIPILSTPPPAAI